MDKIKEVQLEHSGEAQDADINKNAVQEVKAALWHIRCNSYCKKVKKMLKEVANAAVFWFKKKRCDSCKHVVKHLVWTIMKKAAEYCSPSCHTVADTVLAGFKPVSNFACSKMCRVARNAVCAITILDPIISIYGAAAAEVCNKGMGWCPFPEDGAEPGHSTDLLLQ